MQLRNDFQLPVLHCLGNRTNTTLSSKHNPFITQGESLSCTCTISTTTAKTTHFGTRISAVACFKYPACVAESGSNHNATSTHSAPVLPVSPCRPCPHSAGTTVSSGAARSRPQSGCEETLEVKTCSAFTLDGHVDWRGHAVAFTPFSDPRKTHSTVKIYIVYVAVKRSASSHANIIHVMAKRY